MEILGGFDFVGPIFITDFNLLSDKELHPLEWSVISVDVWGRGGERLGRGVPSGFMINVWKPYLFQPLKISSLCAWL